MTCLTKFITRVFFGKEGSAYLAALHPTTPITEQKIQEIAPSYFPSKEMVLARVRTLSGYALSITLINGGIVPTTPDEFAVVIMRFSYAQFLKLGFKGLFKLLELFQHLSTLKKLGLISLFFAPMASAADWNPGTISCCNMVHQVKALIDGEYDRVEQELNLITLNRIPSGCSIPIGRVYLLHATLLAPLTFIRDLFGNECSGTVYSDDFAFYSTEINWATALKALFTMLKNLSNTLLPSSEVRAIVTDWVQQNSAGFSSQHCKELFLNQTIAAISELGKGGLPTIITAQNEFIAAHPNTPISYSMQVCYTSNQSLGVYVGISTVLGVMFFCALGWYLWKKHKAASAAAAATPILPATTTTINTQMMPTSTSSSHSSSNSSDDDNSEHEA